MAHRALIGRFALRNDFAEAAANDQSRSENGVKLVSIS
jgi:hypothetical protein